MKVIQTDGYPVVPVQANSVILGMGERVDAIITVNESLPVVAAPEGKQGHAQLNMRVNNAPSAVNVDDFVASVRKEAPLDTATLSPTPEVTLPAKAPDQVIDARLTGPVNGYTWPVNGKLYNPPNDGVPVKPNQRVRIRFINESMMFHPFHLHGHTFQVMSKRTLRRPARTPCWCRPSRPLRSTSTPTIPAGGSATATTPTTSRRAWRSSSSTRAEDYFSSARDMTTR